MTLRVLLCLLAFVSCGRGSPSPTPTGTPTPTPSRPIGVATLLTKTTTTIPDSVKNNPNIRYISVSDDMWHVEPTEGTFNWSKLDALIAQVPAGKFIRLGIAMSGMRHSLGDSVADWAYDQIPAGEFISYIDTNPNHHWTGWPLAQIAVPWSPTWLRLKKNLIAAVGSHYSGNTKIKIIDAAVFTGANNDWSVPSGTTVDGLPPTDSTVSSRMVTAGYTHAKMVSAGKTILDAYASAFPNQTIIWPTGPVDLSLESDPLSVARTVRDSAFSTWGRNRFMIANFGFSATTRIAPPRTDQDWSIVYEAKPNSGGQAVWFVTGDTTYRMNGGDPGDPVAILEAAFDRFKPYGDYYEIYLADVTDPAMAPAIAYGAALLAGSEPTPSPTPTASPSATVTPTATSTPSPTCPPCPTRIPRRRP